MAGIELARELLVGKKNTQKVTDSYRITKVITGRYRITQQVTGRYRTNYLVSH